MLHLIYDWIFCLYYGNEHFVWSSLCHKNTKTMQTSSPDMLLSLFIMDSTFYYNHTMVFQFWSKNIIVHIYLHVDNIINITGHTRSLYYIALSLYVHCIIICLNFHESLVLDTEKGACFYMLGHTLSIWASETDSCWAMDTARVLSIPVSCLIDSSMLSSWFSSR